MDIFLFLVVYLLIPKVQDGAGVPVKVEQPPPQAHEQRVSDNFHFQGSGLLARV